MLWRRASLLDTQHLEEFVEVVKEKNAQAVLEIVKDTAGGLTLIATEDGDVPTGEVAHVETVDLSREEVDALDVEEGLLRDLDRPLGEVRDATRNGEDQSNG